MKLGYRCHLSFKGPFSATVPKFKGFPFDMRLLVMWKGKWESLLGLWTPSHLWGQLPRSRAFLVPWQGLSQSSPGTLLTVMANNRSQQECVRTGVGASRGSQRAEKGPPQSSAGTSHFGEALLPSAIAGSCFFSRSRCLERFVTMHHGF